MDWVTSTWRLARGTRWAVDTLSCHGETDSDVDLEFIGLDDEWSGGWGRLDVELHEAADAAGL